MRHYQRGIATSIILIIFLLSAVAIASAYFIFSQKQQASKAIDSFEDCAKLYPVMESYPQQCNTPDGRHFVQEISEEEKEKLNPTETATSSATPLGPRTGTFFKGVIQRLQENNVQSR